MQKDIFGYTEKELDALYETMCMDAGASHAEKQEMQKDRFRNLILPLGRNGNKEQKAWALDKLVREGRDFISYYIDRYYPTFKAVYGPDLEGEGMLWLIQNGLKYDPDKGTTFSTFMTLQLKGVMHKYINDQVNNVSVHYGDRMSNIKKAMSQIEMDGRECTIDAIAAQTGYSNSVVKRTLEMIEYNNKVYIDGDDSGFINTLPSEARSPEQIVLEDELTTTLWAAIKKLPKKYRDVIGARFLPEEYFEEEEHSPINRTPGFDAIAKLFGVSPAKIRQYYHKAIIDLRKNPDLIAINDAFKRKRDNAVRDFKVICLEDQALDVDDPFTDENDDQSHESC